MAAELPASLIEALISRGLSQRDLADRLEAKEQQVQRYEATDCTTVSLRRTGEVVGAPGGATGNPARN